MKLKQSARTFCKAAALASCMLLPAACPAASDAHIRGIVDAAIRPVMATHQVPGIAVALSVGGQLHFYNYGVASKETSAPVSEKTLFELGSISKTMTAVLVSHAQETGKLSLSDHPSRFFPQLRGSHADRATLLHLGTYTPGGMPLQFPETVDDEAALAWLGQWKADAAPGTQRVYSNPSLGLFGRAAAVALEAGFADAMHRHVLRPLAMHDSFMQVPPAAMPQYAWGYGSDGKARRMQPGAMAAESYGIRSTSADMIRYVQAHIDPAKLRSPLREALEGTQVGYFQVGPMVQGLGWEQYPYPASLRDLLAGNSQEMIWDPHPARALAAPARPAQPTLFNKTGSTGGFGNYVAFVPARRIGIVILANKNYPIPARVSAAHAILEGLEGARR